MQKPWRAAEDVVENPEDVRFLRHVHERRFNIYAYFFPELFLERNEEGAPLENSSLSLCFQAFTISLPRRGLPGL
jgi:hypothetical protein